MGTIRRKNDPRIISCPQKWFMTWDHNHFFSHNPWSTIRIIFRLWSAIRDPNIFQYDPNLFGSNYSGIKKIYLNQFSLEFWWINQFHQLNTFLLKLLTSKKKIIEMRSRKNQKNNSQNDPSNKSIWSDSFERIHDPDYFFDGPAYSWYEYPMGKIYTILNQKSPWILFSLIFLWYIFDRMMFQLSLET